ncbi:MAG: glycosyltransferase [Anaerolineae bacterium]|nr:glycosyltransferase [Anaerolineae bacterium]
MALTVSVLICTYNRHEMLQQALEALIDDSTDKPDQVVVVNGGDERADTAVRNFIGKYGIEVQLIKTVNVNLATSRNIGLAHCKGDIIAMTDDDAEVFPDWVALQRRSHAEHPDVGAIGGKIIGAQSQHDFLSRLADAATFYSPDAPAFVRTWPGVNISYKKNVAQETGLQDETLPRGEDVDYNWRVKLLGYEIYYDPRPKVIHHHRPTLRKFWQQHYMYGRSYYLVRSKWPAMYCVYPHRVRSLRDVLKWVYFFVSVLWIPWKDAQRMPNLRDRLRAVPILMVNHVLHRFGILQEMWIQRRKSQAKY